MHIISSEIYKISIEIKLEGTQDYEMFERSNSSCDCEIEKTKK